jgi:hypothetical protein
MYVGKAKESENVCVRAIEILSTMYVQAGCIYACRISMVRAPTEKKSFTRQLLLQQFISAFFAFQQLAELWHKALRCSES